MPKWGSLTPQEARERGEDAAISRRAVNGWEIRSRTVRAAPPQRDLFCEKSAAISRYVISIKLEIDLKLFRNLFFDSFWARYHMCPIWAVNKGRCLISFGIVDCQSSKWQVLRESPSYCGLQRPILFWARINESGWREQPCYKTSKNRRKQKGESKQRGKKMSPAKGLEN